MVMTQSSRTARTLILRPIPDKRCRFRWSTQHFVQSRTRKP